MSSSEESTAQSSSALDGIRVIDAATIYAGPLMATLLGDFGADVLKIEHPRGDGLRQWQWSKDGESLWWAFVGRNKRALSLTLSDPRGADILRDLLMETDIFVENFRPGTLERWGLDPADLLQINPRLVIVRVSGFGQSGPYSSRPGFGTLAEAMSGFAETNGPADGPPVLPQWPLADGVAALAGAFATMTALRHAERTGQGQIVDLSIYEPLFWILGAQTSAYDQLGLIPTRQGSNTEYTVPRGSFQTSDGKWIALSGATTPTAQRILRAIGRDDIAEADWFPAMSERLAHRDEIHEAIADWVADRSSIDVLTIFESLGATVAPIYSIEDIVNDPHFTERGSVTTVAHPVLGDLKMQGLIAKLTQTPGSIRAAGPRPGEDSYDVMRQIGYDDTEIKALEEKGIIGLNDAWHSNLSATNTK